MISGPDDHLGDWPWLAHLNGPGCSASLISPNYVISALHCYCYPNWKECDDYSVRLGSVKQDKGGQVYGISDVHFFNNTAPTADALIEDGHDIIVIKVSSFIKRLNSVRLVAYLVCSNGSPPPPSYPIEADLNPAAREEQTRAEVPKSTTVLPKSEIHSDLEHSSPAEVRVESPPALVWKPAEGFGHKSRNSYGLRLDFGQTPARLPIYRTVS